MKSQNFQVVFALTIVALAFSACDPSSEELAEQTNEAELIAIGETAIAQMTVEAASTPTPEPPTPTPLPPTTTPEPWDATVSALTTGLRQEPHLNSQVMEKLLGGTKVDLLAITEDKKWVQVTAYMEGDSAIEGWLLVNMLILNVSLDDLEVDTETVFVQPPTHTPVPTEVPLGERYVNYLLERGFTYYPDQDQYMKQAGRGWLLAAAQDGGQMVGYAIRVPITPEELSEVLAYLEEAGEFLDPGYGWETILVAENGMSQGYTEGRAWKNGRFADYRIVALDATSSRVTFIFLDKLSVIPNPMTFVSSTDCTTSKHLFSYIRSFQRVDVNSSYTVTFSNGYSESHNLDWMTNGQSHTSTVDVDFAGGYAANFSYKIRYVGNDGSSATLIWTCETGEVLQSSWNPAD